MRKRLEQANNYINQNKNKVNDTYRHKYHLMGEIGWINDPNGFSYFQDQYHLFFQYHPYSSKWGAMYWGHATTTDFITWEHREIALAPYKEGVEGGTAFSGCAIEHEKKHFLMYTENWPNRQVQSIAVSTDGRTYIPSSLNPIISEKALPVDAIEADFRDPKILKNEDHYYALISSRNIDSSGQILLYRTNDLIKWEYMNTICRSENKVGKMWECPDLFTLSNQDILIVSPQYMKADGDRYHNLHSAIYMVGQMDFDKGKYLYHKRSEIDHGFDFYAPQTLLDQHGRRIMIAWMAMWERNMPTDDLNHYYAGSMTLPRILEYEEGNLIQKPVDEIKNYRSNFESLTREVSYELQTNLKASVAELVIIVKNTNAEEFGVKLFRSSNEYTLLKYDVTNSTLILDRTRSGYNMAGNPEHDDNSNIRKTDIKLDNNELKLQIFLDKSSIEVFIQNGKRVMSALVYPKHLGEDVSVYSKNGKATFHIEKWDLMR